MGWCRWAGHGWHAGFTKEECDAVIGEYSDTDPNAGTTDTNCFVTTIMSRSLAQTILDLGKTYQTLQSGFRDDVLKSSPSGVEMVNLYYKYNPTLRSIVVKDPELLGNAIHTWFSMQPFVEAVVAGARAGAERAARDQYRDIRFAEVTHRPIEGLFERIGPGRRTRSFTRRWTKWRTNCGDMWV